MRKGFFELTQIVVGFSQKLKYSGLRVWRSFQYELYSKIRQHLETAFVGLQTVRNEKVFPNYLRGF